MIDFITRARAAGKSGADWDEFSYSIGEEIAELDTAAYVSMVDSDAIQRAHADGWREHLVASGWHVLWTTAPVNYDTFGTETVEDCGEWHGRQLRRVVVDPGYADFQISRYGSGLHGTWDKDPRAEEARIRDQIARDKAEQEDRDARRHAGLAWITTADLDGDEDALDAELHSKCLTLTDVGAERKRRREACEAAKRAATWARCRALLPDGATLVDPGSDAVRTQFGVTPGRKPRVWHAVEVRADFQVPDDADRAQVVGEGNDDAGSLLLVAQRIVDDKLRLARSDEVIPPRAVIQRLGIPFTEIVRAEHRGTVIWAGRPTFSYDALVVNEHGHIVRKKALREAGERALRERDFGGLRKVVA
jgi:hypothetical protein